MVERSRRARFAVVVPLAVMALVAPLAGRADDSSSIGLPYNYDRLDHSTLAGATIGVDEAPEQALAGHSHPPRAAAHQYDDRPNVARTSASLGGYRLAPNTAELADDVVRAGDAGSFGSLPSRSVVGDALDLRHMPQAAAGYTTRAQGGALAMPQAEHMLTRTYGFRGAQASLASLFGPDDCFGLAWALIHLVESAPGWPLVDDLPDVENE